MLFILIMKYKKRKIKLNQFHESGIFKKTKFPIIEDILQYQHTSKNFGSKISFHQKPKGSSPFQSNS